MTEENPQVAGGEPQFGIHRIYLKDVSFETPNSPEVFSQASSPDVNLQLKSAVKELGNDVYEVILHLTVTSTLAEKTSFLVEVQQAGLFEIRGFDDGQKAHMLGAYCPNTLFPFARETIADLVGKGGFPQLLLAPINFDALHAQQMQQLSAQASDPQQGAH